MAEREWKIWNLWPTKEELDSERALDLALFDLWNGFYDALNPPIETGANWDRLRGWRWSATRLRIFARDRYQCVYCGDFAAVLECDHVVPITRGGNNEDENLATACFSCNRSKRNKLLSEWMPSYAEQN